MEVVDVLTEISYLLFKFHSFLITDKHIFYYFAGLLLCDLYLEPRKKGYVSPCNLIIAMVNGFTVVSFESMLILNIHLDTEHNRRELIFHILESFLVVLTCVFDLLAQVYEGNQIYDTPLGLQDLKCFVNILAFLLSECIPSV